ncbi:MULTISPECIES: hypothetical protein [unclassified Kitasatospora]|uniref:hypothetical protein n=1 Tax=unclassified Kitasatospora TaxID=2633591 RepID=UPI00340A6598
MAAATHGTSRCSRDADVQTYQAAGGTATVAIDSNTVCLLSAVPAAGFTAKVRHSDPASLVVEFSGNGGTSEISVTSRSQSMG